MEKQANLLIDYEKGNAFKRNEKFADQRHKNIMYVSPIWTLEMFKKMSQDVNKQLQTLATLRKHLPRVYQEHVRLMWTEEYWQLLVQRPNLANELKWITDTLETKIQEDIGFRPKIKIVCKLSQWSTCGQLIRHEKKMPVPLPSKEEADKYIEQFVKELMQS